MMNPKTTTPAKQPHAAKHVENSTDATRGEPLGVRAEKRKAELEAALAKLPADELRARNDIEVVLGSFTTLLTGNSEHLSDTTAAELSRLLENSKHLAELAPAAKKPRA
jgi:hypothetical protein